MSEEQKGGDKPKEATKSGGDSAPQKDQETKATHAPKEGASVSEKKHAVDEAQRLAKGLCIAERCKEGAVKYRFCSSHFEAYQLGLMTKHGVKAKDFEHKMRNLVRKNKIKAA